MREPGLQLSRTAIVSIAGSFLIMGLVVSSYGPLLEQLTRRFAVSLPVAGTTISIHFAGALIGVLLAMRSNQRLPTRATVIAATAMVAAGCAGVALAQAWPVFATSVFCIGLGFGALVIALNQAVAYSEGGRRAALLNGLNAVYSGGAVAGPVLVAVLARSHFPALFLVIAALSLFLVPGDAGIRGRLPAPAGGRARSGRLVLVFVTAFVLYVAIENGVGGWMTSHLESTGMASAVAATFTSGFWLALFSGRVLMTLMPSRVAEAKIVLVASGAAAAALIAASISELAPWAYIVAGLALAPIFPTGIVWLARLRPGDAGVTSWLFPAAEAGGIAGPGAIGLVIAGFGVAWTPVMLAAVATGMSIAFWGANRASASDART